jgi:WD40-like Beta Propeller Repeat
MKNACLRVAIVVLLLAALAAPARAQFGQNKIAYDKFDWSIYRSTHFQIYYYPKEKDSLQKLASFAESAYDELSRALNYQIPHPIPVIAYATHAEFEQTNTDLNFIPEGVGAFALPTRDRIVLPIDLPDEILQKIIQHELTHIFEFEILFQGNFVRAFTSSPPQWFMEGLASYYGHDEDNYSRMYIRDAVLTDLVPEVAKRGNQLGGYFAYRFGHAVFDFIEAEWGKDAVRDFVYEWRTNLGGGVEKVIKRAFDLSAEDFDIKFRRYLRQKYLPILTSKGEPIDFGERYHARKEDDRRSWETSPAPFPSGDFLGAVSTYDQNPDVVVFSSRDRKLFANLTKGYTTKYEYLVSQFVTISATEPGRSLGVSPDGNHIVAFVRRERGRNLALFNVLKKSLEREIPLPVDQQLSPSYSPDGKSIVFSAVDKGHSNIFVYNLESGKLSNATQDDAWDAAPTYSPDGKWIYYSSKSQDYNKIFRVDAANPSRREQITFGDFNDVDSFVSPDGSRLYFSSDRDGGVYNIFSLDLKTGETWQHTNVVGGAYTPVVFAGKDGIEKLVFCGYFKLRFSLYLADAKKPVKKLAALTPPPVAVGAQPAPKYTPAIEVAIDPEKIQKKPSKKLYVEGANIAAGVNSDNTLFSNSSLFFSDNLGDRLFSATLQSISTFTDFNLSYVNLRNRLRLGGSIFDTREYFIGSSINSTTGLFSRGRRFLRETGAILLASYPLDRYHRFDGTVGYISRSLDQPFFETNADGTQAIFFGNRRDNDPTGGIAFTGDTALDTEIGPLAGHRYSIGYSYTPDLKRGDEVVGTDANGNPLVSKHGGTLSQSITVDLRQYLRISKRSTLAIRLFGARSTGNFPDIFSFGGVDTLRAYDFRSQIGNELAFGNVEFRFPLIDQIALFGGGLILNNIRGRVFVDVGASNFSFSHQTFRFWNGSGHDEVVNGITYRSHQLINGLADYGYGFSIGLLGVDLHWDFARQWDFRNSLSSFRTSFYIGTIF